jgi:hypothetical protein
VGKSKRTGKGERGAFEEGNKMRGILSGVINSM